ncbi:MAG: hypothetical protein WC117_03140 [Sphaerochaetaceae bacterium]|jgi:hypothetical protein|nr:hypothetical protein [Sphaerochaetaceae bacterium]
MKIIEKFIEGKDPDQRLCEDRIFISPFFAAVFDGVTSKSDKRWNGETGGVHAINLLGEVLECLDPDSDVYSFASKATAAFSDECSRRGITASNDRIQACCVVYSFRRKELWFIGDCKAMVDGKEVVSPMIDAESVYSNARALFLECELVSGKTLEQIEADDTGRAFILPLVKKYSVFANNGSSEYGYSVINGLPIPASLIHVAAVSSGCSEIVLSSDGYPKLFPTLGETESYLKALLEKDPLCFRENKRPKGLHKGNYSFDDRAYLRFRPN